VHVWRQHDGRLLLWLTDYVINLEAFVVVRVENFNFPFVVAACTLVTLFATARPVLGVGKVGLLLPGLFVEVRLGFVWIGAFEVGVLARKLVGLVGLDKPYQLPVFRLLSFPRPFMLLRPLFECLLSLFVSQACTAFLTLVQSLMS